MNALGASILVLLVVVILSATRHWALIAVLAGILYLPLGQQVQILGLNMYALRFIEVAGFFRIIIRKEFSFRALNAIDKIILLLFAYSTAVFVIRANEPVAYKIGAAADTYLCYFTFRGLLANVPDLKRFLVSFLILLIPYVLLLAVQSLGGQNFFSLIGGVSYSDYVRNGRPRCFGTFQHPSLLGTLGAVFAPLYAALALNKNSRAFGVLGILLCVSIVLASNSGGPASGFATAILCWFFWPLRKKMYVVRRAMCAGIILLAFIMKAPIWYLPARVSAISGGDGYHRSHLMDMAFQDLNKWWLFGMPLTETRNWFPYTLDTGAADMTNQYLSFGMTAGLAAMALFVFLFVKSFSSLGCAMTVLRERRTATKSAEYLLWGLGGALVVHAINLIGITYFDQTYAIWYFEVAAISSLSQSLLVEANSVGVKLER